MERVTWKATVLDGMLDEYIRRHDEIWDEMTATLNDAGIHNYSIWNVGNTLFGYYEAEKGATFAADVQSSSEIVTKWNEYMKDVMIMDIDPKTGTAYSLNQVFFHK